MKRFYFYFTIFYTLIYVSGVYYIAYMSLFVALFMGFGAFALCVLCSTFMNEELFKEYTGWSMKQSKKVSIRKKLSQVKERQAQHRERQKTKSKERDTAR